VAGLEGIDAEDVAMYMCGQPLESAMLLSSFASDLSTIELEVRLLGGMYALCFSSI